MVQEIVQSPSFRGYFSGLVKEGYYREVISGDDEILEEIECSTSEVLESLGKNRLHRALAGGRLLKSVLTYLINENFSPLGCLILVQQNNLQLPVVEEEIREYSKRER